MGYGQQENKQVATTEGWLDFIEQKTTRDQSKTFHVLGVAGIEISYWGESYLEVIQAGQYVSATYTIKGKYKNLETIQVIDAPPGQSWQGPPAQQQQAPTPPQPQTGFKAPVSPPPTASPDAKSAVYWDVDRYWRSKFDMDLRNEKRINWQAHIKSAREIVGDMARNMMFEPVKDRMDVKAYVNEVLEVAQLMESFVCAKAENPKVHIGNGSIFDEKKPEEAKTEEPPVKVEQIEATEGYDRESGQHAE